MQQSEDHKKSIGIMSHAPAQSLLPVDVLIMAGGRGSRLSPLTDALPKPLLPLNHQPLLSYTLQHLTSFGIQHANISMNYLAEVLESYIANTPQENLKINTIREDTPLGTVGAMSLMEAFSFDTVLLMNADLLTNIALDDFYAFHCEKNADITVATVPYEVTIPYGVTLTDSANHVFAFKEKPTFSYQANAGIYLISTNTIQLIPKGQRFDATDLISEALRQQLVVNAFPIKNFWLDIGNHEDYARAQKAITDLQFGRKA